MTIHPTKPARPHQSRQRKSNDQHYKTLFRTFLRELLLITHPDIVPKLLFDKCRFLDKETYSDLLGGQGYRLDLVCEIPTTDGDVRLVLIHIEVEERARKDRKLSFGQRMANYFMTLSLRHQVPVLPMVVTFAARAGGLVTDEYELCALGETVFTLRYRRLGVRGLSAAKFLRGKNPLGYALAIRMKRGQKGKADLQLACERKIIHADNVDENEKLLLLNSVRSYAGLSPAQRQEYRKKLERKQNREVKETAMTWLDKEVSKARAQERRRVLKEAEKKAQKIGDEREQRGKQLGAKQSLLRSIGKFWAKRFGPLPEDVAHRLEAVPEPSQLERIMDAILDAPDQAEALATITSLCPA